MAAWTRNASAELLRLPDCGGLLENGKCRWLNVPSCLGAGCSFYQGFNSQTKSKMRLRALDDATQERIARKYYGGTRPWLNDNEKNRR